MSNLDIALNFFDRLTGQMALQKVERESLRADLAGIVGDLLDGRSDGDPEIRAFVQQLAEKAVGSFLDVFEVRLQALENRLGINTTDYPENGADPSLAPPVLTGETVSVNLGVTDAPLRADYVEKTAPTEYVEETVGKTDEVPSSATDEAYRVAGFKFHPVTGAPL